MVEEYFVEMFCAYKDCCRNILWIQGQCYIYVVYRASRHKFCLMIPLDGPPTARQNLAMSLICTMHAADLFFSVLSQDAPCLLLL